MHSMQMLESIMQKHDHECKGAVWRHKTTFFTQTFWLYVPMNHKHRLQGLTSKSPLAKDLKVHLHR